MCLYIATYFVYIAHFPYHFNYCAGGWIGQRSMIKWCGKMQMWHTGENNEKTWTLEKKKKAKSKGTRTEVVKEVAAAGSGYNSVFSVLMGTELESVVVKVCGKKKKSKKYELSYKYPFFFEVLWPTIKVTGNLIKSCCFINSGLAEWCEVKITLAHLQRLLVYTGIFGLLGQV